ncbi:MAG: hypothetical protein H0W81_03065 [Chloroflexi bacterium]|nr:hypothetical protein [Chloroflexota bacterium]
MISRLRGLGFVLALIGMVFIAAGAFAFIKTQEGYRSLNAFSAAQDVQLTYNDKGQLVDRGETEGAQSIMALLTEDWQYPVAASELDPNDPIVNTSSEYMYQMATVSYHTLNGTQTVVLTEPAEYKGETFPAGTYEVPIDGRYFSQLDRQHPLEGPAREQAWSGTAHALVAELGVGTATASALQLALALVGLLGGLGGTLILTGAGLVWATRPESQPVPVLRTVTVPA